MIVRQWVLLGGPRWRFVQLRTPASASQLHCFVALVHLSNMGTTTNSRTTMSTTPPRSKLRKNYSPRKSTTRAVKKNLKAFLPSSPGSAHFELSIADSALPSEYELGADGTAIVDELTGGPKLSEYGSRLHVEAGRPLLEVMR